MSSKEKIAFIGGGHIARAMIAGLVAGGRTPTDIEVVDRNLNKREALQKEFGVQAVEHQHSLSQDADIVLLAVKPADIPAACAGLKQKDAIIVSTALGISLGALAKWIPFPPYVLARAMPNTPLAAAAGMTVCYADASEKVRAQITSIFSCAGKVLWLEGESMLSAATAVSGCGPAYLYYLAEAMEEAAMKMGFSASEARLLTVQTLKGGSAMLDCSDTDAKSLRQAVAVPGGATEQAILTMESDNLKEIVKNAMAAAKKKSDQIGKETE